MIPTTRLKKYGCKEHRWEAPSKLRLISPRSQTMSQSVMNLCRQRYGGGSGRRAVAGLHGYRVLGLKGYWAIGEAYRGIGL